MLLTAILVLLSPGLGEARRRKELPIDREPGEAGTQQRAKASGEQSICATWEKRIGFHGFLICCRLPWVCWQLQWMGTVRQFFGWVAGQVAALGSRWAWPSLSWPNMSLFRCIPAASHVLSNAGTASHNPQSVPTVLLPPVLQHLSLSLHDTGEASRTAATSCCLVNPGETRHTKWSKLQRSTRNCREKSESRGKSGLEDCSSPRKT